MQISLKLIVPNQVKLKLTKGKQINDEIRDMKINKQAVCIFCNTHVKLLIFQALRLIFSLDYLKRFVQYHTDCINDKISIVFT